MKNLPENIDSKYRFITIAAQRCDMLQKGAKAKIDEEKFTKFTSVAMEEVVQGLIEFEVLESKTKQEEEKVD
ncbi:MAG TPA: DNA-directed RNA polymerase subunit omega [Acidobacteriota bacterium]|nr:DNA-directed RNA polymerase subunit omega [Acidobacteriota bacterium]